MDKLLIIMGILLVAVSAEFVDKFDSLDKEKWEIVSGEWRVKDGVLKGSSGGGDGLIFVKDKVYKNFILECKIKVENREGSIAFGAQDKKNLYIMVFNPKIGKDAQGSVLLIRRVKGKETYFAGAEQYVKSNEWIKIKLVVENKKIDIYANDRFVLSVDDENIAEGKAGFRIFGDFLSGCDAYFDDFSIKSLEN